MILQYRALGEALETGPATSPCPARRPPRGNGPPLCQPLATWRPVPSSPGYGRSCCQVLSLLTCHGMIATTFIPAARQLHTTYHIQQAVQSAAGFERAKRCIRVLHRQSVDRNVAVATQTCTARSDQRIQVPAKPLVPKKHIQAFNEHSYLKAGPKAYKSNGNRQGWIWEYILTIQVY